MGKFFCEMESFLLEWVPQPIFTAQKLKLIMQRRTMTHLGLFSNEEHLQLFGKQKKYKKYFERDDEEQFLTIITTSFSGKSMKIFAESYLKLLKKINLIRPLFQYFFLTTSTSISPFEYLSSNLN